MIRSALVLVCVTVAAPAFAQFRSVIEPPPVCVIECQPGKDGRDGKDGKDGRDGRDAERGPWSYRPFDVGAHGIEFNIMARVQDGPSDYLLLYTAQFHAAALLDPRTGLAQVVMPFTAGLGGDPRGLITFDDVTVLAPRSFVWRHRGAGWNDVWDDTIKWQPLAGYRINGVPLFRWR